jgi:signal transduction histidine kinase
MGSWNTLIFQSLFFGALTVFFVAFAPPEARPWIAACGLACLVLFIVLSFRRHKEIRRLAAQIDKVLHNGRSIDFTSYREGDVAVLANELGKMVARLSRLSDSLSKERNALADALADISHQTRTPLTAISLRLPTIEAEEDPRERKRLLRELESMIERMSWLQTTLLKIAKVDAGAIHVEQREVFAAEAVRRAIAPLEPSFDLRDIALEVELDEKATFQGDLLWSAEAIQNIAKNCMEHTPAGGMVRIKASENALATTIVITDTGAGFAEADLPYLFDRFYRGANANAPEQEGFGIGLALAQSLISVQGGTIRANNTAEGGARFQIAFPKITV